MLSGEYKSLAPAVEPAPGGPDGRQRKLKREIPAYYKAGVIGCGLILLIVAVVAVAFWNVITTTRSAERIVNHYQPALLSALGIQYDLHEAQVMLGNFLMVPASLGREAYITRYREHISRARQRFSEFQALVPDLPDPAGLQNDYLV
ncbi:MAG TPA: hypothetical protein VMK82_06670, partial [Steroidobacteraceae bacterium]|nr:hypothetical protein [Steroidobacteraceae bacterium]